MDYEILTDNTESLLWCIILETNTQIKEVFIMSAIDFPDNPSVNDTFTYDDNTWQWTGQFWELLPFAVQGIQGTQGVQGLPGPTPYSSSLLFF